MPSAELQAHAHAEAEAEDRRVLLAQAEEAIRRSGMQAKLILIRPGRSNRQGLRYLIPLNRRSPQGKIVAALPDSRIAIEFEAIDVQSHLTRIHSKTNSKPLDRLMAF